MTGMSKIMRAAASKNDFKSQVEVWVREAGIEIDEVHIRPLKNKWSSCSENGRLTLSSELLSQSEGFQKEVVMRELLSISNPQEGRMSRVFLRAFGVLQFSPNVPWSMPHSRLITN